MGSNPTRPTRATELGLQRLGSVLLDRPCSYVFGLLAPADLPPLAGVDPAGAGLLPNTGLSVGWIGAAGLLLPAGGLTVFEVLGSPFTAGGLDARCGTAGLEALPTADPEGGVLPEPAAGFAPVAAPDGAALASLTSAFFTGAPPPVEPAVPPVALPADCGATAAGLACVAALLREVSDCNEPLDLPIFSERLLGPVDLAEALAPVSGLTATAGLGCAGEDA